MSASSTLKVVGCVIQVSNPLHDSEAHSAWDFIIMPRFLPASWKRRMPMPPVGGVQVSWTVPALANMLPLGSHHGYHHTIMAMT